MPIRGITDKEAQFPEIGTIRKGKARDPEKPREKLEDLNYFRFDLDPEEAELLPKLHSWFGVEPKTIDVFLPFREKARNWITWREAYLAGGLIHRCDGEFVQYEIDYNSGAKVVVNGRTADGKQKPCDGTKPVGEYFSEAKKKNLPIFCKPVGRLRVIIPQVGRLVFFTVLTGSVWDIAHIDQQLDALFLVNGCSLTGIPLKLQRREHDVSCPGDGGKRVRRTKSLLSIEADPEWTAKKIRQMKIQSLPEPIVSAEVRELPAPEGVTEAEADGDETEEQLPPIAAQGESWGGGVEAPDEDGPREELELPMPRNLSVDMVFNFATDNNKFKEAARIMQKHKGDPRAAWIELLKDHIPPDKWPRG